jgi:hypothetical protein
VRSRAELRLAAWGSSAAALLAAAILLPELRYPLARDQGVFACVGETLLRGGAPYRDAWDIKPPAIYWTYALILSALGRSALAIHAADLATASAVAAGLYLLARRAAGLPGGLMAAGWYAALYLRGGFWSLGQAESFANLPLVLAALALIRPGGVRTMLIAGLAIGMAALYKVTLLLPGGAILAWGLWQRRREGWMRLAVAAVVGVTLPLAGARAWMGLTGCWSAYLELQSGFLRPYAALPPAGPHAGLAASTLAYARGMLLPLSLALGGAAAWVVDRARDRGAAGRDEVIPLCLLWTGAAYLAIAVQDKYFGYHWTTLLPPLAVLAGAGWARVVEGVAALRNCLTAPHPRSGCGAVRPLQDSSTSLTAFLAVAIVLTWSLVGRWPRYRDTARLALGRLDRSRYEASFGNRPGKGDFSPLADRWVAAYLREQTQPGEPVFIWGFEPLVYFLAHRWPPTRFLFNVPQILPGAPSDWREELVRSLSARPPVVFVVVRHDAVPWASGTARDSAAELDRFPELASFLRQRYRPETVIEDFTIYRWRGEEENPRL